MIKKVKKNMEENIIAIISVQSGSKHDMYPYLLLLNPRPQLWTKGENLITPSRPQVSIFYNSNIYTDKEREAYQRKFQFFSNRDERLEEPWSYVIDHE